MAPLEQSEPLVQGRVARGQFQLVTNVAVQALQLVALARQLSALAGHLHFHFPHLLHHRLLVILQLVAFLLVLFAFLIELATFPFQLVAERKQFLFVRSGLVGRGLRAAFEFLNLQMELADDLGLLFQHRLVFFFTLRQGILPLAGRVFKHSPQLGDDAAELGVLGAELAGVARVGAGVGSLAEVRRGRHWLILHGQSLAAPGTVHVLGIEIFRRARVTRLGNGFAGGFLACPVVRIRLSPIMESLGTGGRARHIDVSRG